MANGKICSIVEFKLITSTEDEKYLGGFFELCRQLYNSILGESVRRVAELRADPEWKVIKNISDKEEKAKKYEQIKSSYGFTEQAIRDFGTLCRSRSNAYFKRIPSHIVQTIAVRAFRAAEKLIYGKAKKVRFKSANRFYSVDAKQLNPAITLNNVSRRIKRSENFSVNIGEQLAITIGDSRTNWGLKNGKALKITLDIDWSDEVVRHALKHTIKYCRLVRRFVKGRVRWFVQLVYAGLPCQKTKNKITQDKSRAIVDLNLNKASIVSSNGYCENIPLYPEQPYTEIHNRINRLQKAIERSDRDYDKENGNKNYEPDRVVKVGTKKRTKKGKAKKGRRTHNSSRSRAKKVKTLAYLHRKLSESQKNQHRRHINIIISKVKNFGTEDITGKGWNKLWGEAVKGNAPFFFLRELERKVLAVGGIFEYFSTYLTCLSQRHLDGSKTPKTLADRIHHDNSGFVVDRDLMSGTMGLGVSGKAVKDKSRNLYRIADESLKIDYGHDFQELFKKLLPKIIEAGNAWNELQKTKYKTSLSPRKRKARNKAIRKAKRIAAKQKLADMDMRFDIPQEI